LPDWRAYGRSKWIKIPQKSGMVCQSAEFSHGLKTHELKKRAYLAHNSAAERSWIFGGLPCLTPFAGIDAAMFRVSKGICRLEAKDSRKA
jgi:hypothetical protein